MHIIISMLLCTSLPLCSIIRRLADVAREPYAADISLHRRVATADARGKFRQRGFEGRPQVIDPEQHQVSSTL